MSAATRALIKARGELTQQSADQVIQEGLAALDRETLRKVVRQQALALAHDEADKAEMRAVRADLDDVRAR